MSRCDARRDICRLPTSLAGTIFARARRAAVLSGAFPLCLDSSEPIVKLTIFDTHAASLNTGDAIIMEACESVIGSIFPHADISRFPTHIPISASDFMKAQRNDFAFLCGTNAFRGKWRLRARKNQWALSGWQLAISRPIISLGGGLELLQYRLREVIPASV